MPRARRFTSRLAAVNSPELRFFSGATTLHNHKTIASSFSDVMVASMTNYFFASPTGKIILDPQPQESEMIINTHMESISRADQEQRIFSPTLTATRVSSSSSSAVLAPAAPRSILLTQHSFRASTGSAAAGRSREEEESVNGASRPRVKHPQQLPDDNTSPLQEKSSQGLFGSPLSERSIGKKHPPPRQGYGYSIQLSEEEKSLFRLLRKVHEESNLTTTLRVAGGWVRDKLLATPEFQIFHYYNNHEGKRLTSKFKSSGSSPSRTMPSMGRQGTKILSQVDRQGPVDIDIALDTMLGREFADHLNDYLQDHGKDTVSVGVVLKNPEKSKHLETATMKVGTFWIDFVNLRAEEYAEDSRIPELMRIGTAKEDAFRRDLTINSLFYNINTGQVEDWTGRGFADLRRGVVATPLAPLTTLLDDPLRVLRSVRFAARLRFAMDEELVVAAKDRRVRIALEQKVSRERVGGEVDLMLRSPDPVGAMRLLKNLNLVDAVFPVAACLSSLLPGSSPKIDREKLRPLFDQSLNLLSTTHDHLFDCKITPPCWCENKRLLTTQNVADIPLTSDEEARRLLWYAAFLKPMDDYSRRLKQNLTGQDREVSKRSGKKSNRSILSALLVDELKRPGRDAEAVEKITKAANEITQLIQSGCDVSATMILLSDVKVREKHGILKSTMNSRAIDSSTEEDPVWEHAMEFRLLCARVLKKVGSLWRAALMLSLSEQLASLNDGDLDYAIEGDVFEESKGERRQGIIEQYDAFAAALQQIGLIGIWGSAPLIDGKEMKEVLPKIPPGPAFREVMDEQERWMVTHPGASKEPLTRHLKQIFPEFASPREGPGKKTAPEKAPKKKPSDEKASEGKRHDRLDWLKMGWF